MEQKEFVQIFRLAKELFNNPVSDGLATQEAADSLSAFILHICRNNKSKQQLSSSARAMAYRRIVETMEKEIYSNLSLAEIL